MRKEKDVKQKQKYTLTRAEERAIAKENRRAMKHFEALKARKNVKESEYLTQMHDPNNIVEFDNLHTYFYTDAGVVKAVDGVSFDIPRGSTVCVVGESGCGKSVTSLSLMQLVQAPQGQITAGEIRYNAGDKSYNVAKMPTEAMRKIRGKQISMIFQDPMTSLNPVMTVAEQIAEVIRLHEKCSKKEAHKKACDMLELVGIRPERGSDYPHQFSGGMKQRVVIAMALACNPRFLIADEPTTALDVTIQAQVLELMKKLKAQYQTAMVMITHDLGIVAEICDYVAIMYAGEIVEYGTREHIFNHTGHPYTKGLFACIPDIFTEQNELVPINGLTPDPTDLPVGCRFHPRCPYATEQCAKEHPANFEIEPGHYVACHLARSGGNDNV